MTSVLRADLYVAPQIPLTTPKPLPFGIPQTWSPMASTLISGEHEALLVDPPLTLKQGHELAEWIKSVIPDKRLATVFVTHGHGDHYFALTSLLEHFPEAHVVATSATIEHMKQQVEPRYYETYWGTWFPGQIKPPTTVVRPLDENNVISLEGHKLQVVEAGHSDTQDTSFLHVPELSLVVAGDICYNDVHQWLVEATTEAKRNAWIGGLEKIIALNPGTVIASHKRPGAVDGISNVHATIEYIRTFGELKKISKDATELYHAMIRRYPNRVNPVIIWLGCQANYQ